MRGKLTGRSMRMVTDRRAIPRCRHQPSVGCPDRKNLSLLQASWTLSVPSMINLAGRDSAQAIAIESVQRRRGTSKSTKLKFVGQVVWITPIPGPTGRNLG